MQDFVIRISTPANLSGASATHQALVAVTGAAEKLIAEERAAGRSADELGGKVAKLRDAGGGFTGLSDGAAKAGKSMRQLAGDSEGFLAKIKTGFGIGLGEKLLHSVEEIGHAFSEAVREGIAYNAEMETLGVGLGATFRSVEPGKYLNFDEARKAGVETLDQLREKANALGVDFHGLAESYGANLNALIEGGVTRPAQQITLISTLIQAATSKGVTGVQALKDSIDILNGRAGNIVLAKELGLENDALKRAAASGETYSYIMGKLGGYQEGASAGAQTYAGTLATLHNQLEQLAGDLAKPAFDKLVQLMQGGKGLLGSAEVAGTAKGVGNTLGGLLEEVQGKTSAIESFLGKHPAMARLLGMLPQAVQDVSGLPVANENTLLNATAANVQASYIEAQVDQQKSLLDSLHEQIASAKDAKTTAAARQALEEAIAKASERTAAAQGEGKERAHDFLLELQAVERSFSKIQERRKEQDAAAASERAQKSDAAQAKYEASPRARSAEAGVAADADDAAKAKHEAEVDAVAANIRKNKDFKDLSPEAARADAEREVSAKEILRDTKALNKELEGVVEKEERAAKSYEVAAKIRENYQKIFGLLPEEKQDGLNHQPGQENLVNVTKAVVNLPVADGDREALRTKEQLVKALQDAVRLQGEYNAAEKREDSQRDKEKKEADARAAEGKAHDDTLRAQQDELAIMQAKANRQDELATKLQKEKEAREEITRLMREGLTYAEAQNTVESKQKAQDQIDHQPPPGTIIGKPVDTDPDGGLHSGKLGPSSEHRSRTTKDLDPEGGIHSGGDVPRLPDRSFTPRAADTKMPSLGLPALNLAPTAAAGVGLALPPPSTGAGGGAADGPGTPGGGGGNALTSATKEVATAADGAKQSATKIDSSMQNAAASMQQAARSLAGLKGVLDQINQTVKKLADDVQTLQAQMQSLYANG